MRKSCLAVIILTLSAVLVGTASCDNGTPAVPEPAVEDIVSLPPAETEPTGPDFDLIFRYGIQARNTLDTFQGKYIKDMVADPSIRIDLNLTGEEKIYIYEKMVEIDFFNYPDKFAVIVPPGESSGIVTPYSSYYFKVEYESQTKELLWADNIVLKDTTDKKADKLKELIKFIRNIIETKPEYMELPEPTSAYQ